MAVDHPTLAELLETPPGPAVEAHLGSCPRCRIEARLFAEAEATDTGALEGIDAVREDFQRLSAEAPGTLSRSFSSAWGEAREDLEVGRVVERYEILERVGAGGMGTVYRVRHLQLGSVHALKVMRGVSARERTRLFREARAQGQLRHPHVVPVTDIVDIDGAPGVIMDYVDGPSLAVLLARDGPPSLEVADRLAQGIIRGVAAVHRAGLVHRDLKPGNVLIAEGDEGPVARVSDFGLVRTTDPGGPGEDQLTRSGTPMGTPAYMAPEQIRDASRADERSDVFSLGAVLYELLAGRRAFGGLDIFDVFERIRAGRYPPLGPEVPQRMVRAVEGALRPDAEARLPDCEALVATWRGEAGVAAERARRRVPSRALLAGLALLAAAAAVVLRPEGEAPEPDEAVPQVRSRVLARDAVPLVQPALSPDGAALAYVREAQLVVEALDGAERRVLSEAVDAAHPAFSPDGERIAYASAARGDGIHLVAVAGGASERLTSFGTFPDWSPDGRQLAFSTESFQRPEFRGVHGELWVVDLGTRRTRLVVAGDANMPDWSPGGGRIAFWGSHEGGVSEIYTVDAAGEEVVRLTDTDALDWNPRWSPDGRFVYFLSDRSGAGALWRVAVDEASGRALGQPQPVTTGGAEVPRFLSGDRSGRRWVIQASVLEQNLLALPIDIASESTGEPAWVTRGPREVQQATLSPDGTRVAFTERAEGEVLYVAGRDGGRVEEVLRDPGRVSGPSWSPDGSRIAFSIAREGTYAVWTVHPDGSGLARVTEGSGALLPVWSPDATRLVVGDWGEGTASIVELSEAGTQASRRQLLLPHLDVGYYGPSSWSPDGRLLLLDVYGAPDAAPRAMVYDLETDGYAALEHRGTWWPRWLDEDTILTAQDGQLTTFDWPQGELEPRWPWPAGLRLLWWDLSEDRTALVMVLESERAVIRALELESSADPR